MLKLPNDTSRSLDWNNDLFYDNLWLTKRLTAIALSWPSWVWKDSLINLLLSNFPQFFIKPIQFTTRKARDWEIEWIDYNFLSLEDFENLKNKWDIFFYTNPYWDFYWFTRDEIQRVLNSWRIPLFNSGPSFWNYLKENIWQEVSVFKIFIDVPNYFSWFRRIIKRDWIYKTNESWEYLLDEKWKRIKKEEILRRIEKWISMIKNAKTWEKYDFIIVNWDLTQSIIDFSSLCLNILEWKYKKLD